MEHRMNFGSWWQLQLIGHSSYLPEDGIRSIKARCKLQCLLGSHEILVVWLKAEINLFSYLKMALTSPYISKLLHAVLSLLEILPQESDQLSSTSQQSVH
jgi:hypothetical protein